MPGKRGQQKRGVEGKKKKGKRTKQIEKGRRKKKNLCVLGKGWKEVCGLEPRGIGLPFLSVCYKNTN